MNISALFFAQMPDDLAPHKFRVSSSSRELIVVIGAVALVCLLAVFWAVFFRKKPRRHRRSHSHPPSTPDPATPAPLQADSGSETKEGSRRRRRRRSELPRNPTLAETGGLPPIRGDGPSEPSG